MIELACIVLLLPLLAFTIQIFVGKRLPRGGDWLPTGAMFLCLGLSVVILAKVLAAYDPDYKETFSFMWIDIGDFRVEGGILLDNVTAIMLVVVTLVSALVHLYSIGYMHDDPLYSRFFAYLGLFSFSMLGLVLSDNFLFLYCFWELVGLTSYLLIGFWFERPAAASAGKKAFIVTRIGDVGMFIGIMIIFSQIGKFGYQGVFDSVAQGELSGTLLTVAGVCIFFGAVGKSAQFPLHVWLPDAMEGPTPVSALIHAATMVAAGVYLVVRVFPFLSPDALTFIAYTGVITAFLGATIAIAQNDIKRVLAYSTISQLGYMMLGLGVGAYVAGFFHLVTHAAFKACLFLCSGSVIHALGTQDMREMGGLKDKMPITFKTMLIATLAISGVPLTSGFLSKDAILAGSLGFGFFEQPRHMLLPLLGFITAGMTAFYMFRLIFMTFYGQPRDREKYEHAHESPKSMTIPLVVLSSLTFFFFYTFNFNPFSTSGWFYDIIHKPASSVHQAVGTVDAGYVLASSEAHDPAHIPALMLSLLIAAGGIYLAYLTYYKGRISADAWADRFSFTYRLIYNKWYFDELYHFIVIRPTLAIRSFLGWFDQKVIDGVVNGAARITTFISFLEGRFDNIVIDGLVNQTAGAVIGAGSIFRKIQTGRVQTYIMFALVGAIIIFLIRVAVEK